MTASAALLELAGVTKSFGALKVTDDLSFTLARGEALGVIGPNGAGKSTLLKLINGQLRPDQGAMYFEGRSLAKEPPERRCRAGIATAFQIPQPFGAMTVFENLLVAAAFAGKRRESECRDRCAEILRRTGLLREADRAAEQLKLLDRKRLELARSLACHPTLLLLDEIAGGLTDQELPQLIDIIRSLRAEGIAIFWIEHVVHALLAVVDRLLVIDFGAVVACGEPQAVFVSPTVRRIYLGIDADAARG